MIDEQNFFDQPVKNNLRTYDNVGKITISQRDDYTTGCLQNYPYCKENYKLIAKDLSKQQALDANPKAIHQINFAGNLDQPKQRTMLFITEEGKETILDFTQETDRTL